MEKELLDILDTYQSRIIQSVTNISPVLLGLRSYKIISHEEYAEIMCIPGSEGKMRALFSGPLRLCGVKGKEIFYQVLKEHEPRLIRDLQQAKCANIMEKVESAASVIERLLETLKHLSDAELQNFKEALGGRFRTEISLMVFMMTDLQGAVFFMVQTFGHRSEEMTVQVLTEMKRPDLAQQLSDSSSGSKQKHSGNKVLIYKVATMSVVKDVLMETLGGLSSEVSKWLLQFRLFQRGRPSISFRRMRRLSWSDSLLDVMVEMLGQQSVEVAREVLMDMNRTDLVQRLSEFSSGPKAESSVDELWPALTQEVGRMASATELLLETLSVFSPFDFFTFSEVILKLSECYTGYSDLLLTANTDSALKDVVFLMVLSYGQESVEKTKDILKKMKKDRLVQKLSDSSAEPKKERSADEPQSTLIQRIATMAAVKHLLLETLKDLSDEELDTFKELLRLTVSQKDLPDISSSLSYISDRAKIVDQMVQSYGRLSVGLTREVFMDMDRTDLVKRLSTSSSGLKEKHRPALLEKVPELAAVTQTLPEILNDLSATEFEKFKFLLQFTLFQRSLPQITFRYLDYANTSNHLVDLMVHACGWQSKEVTQEVLMDMNRTDLVQKLTKTISELLEKRSVDEQQPSLSQRVERMKSATEMLLETVKDLNDQELETFKRVLFKIHRQRHSTPVPPMLVKTTDRQDVVFLLVQAYSKRSVETTREALKLMKRTNLVLRLSDSSSRPEHKVDDHLSALIHKVATVAAFKDVLFETLIDLSCEDLKKFKWFLQLTFFQKGLPHIPWKRVQEADKAYVLMDAVVEMCGQQCVQVAAEVLMDMNRTDLMQRLSEFSSGPGAAGSSAKAFSLNTMEREKQTLDERRPELILKVETMVSVTELLLETMKDLSDQEFDVFKGVLLRLTDVHRGPSDVPQRLLETTVMQDTVFLMVLTYGQVSVEMIKEVLKNKNRTDLSQRLSDSRSRPKEKDSADELQSTLVQRVATMAAVKQLLLETLRDLSDGELEKFKQIGQFIFYREGLPDISWTLRHTAERKKIVDQMVQTYGKQSVELTREVLMDMDRTDLVHRLSKPSSELKEKHHVDEGQPALLERAAAMSSVKQTLLETLSDLNPKEFENFRCLLQISYFLRSLPQIPPNQLQWADRADLLLDLILANGQPVEVTKEVFMDMNRTDLAERLSETSSALKVLQFVPLNLKESRKAQRPSDSLELEACGGRMASADWTELEPEVNSSYADESSAYSLQSGAGSFECSISGLRWVCTEKVSFKYQFVSWEGHMERVEIMQYQPAGPLMDITVIAGKLDEVHLPHWICIDDNPKILDKFAVLHIDDCGDVVEKVCEVTKAHVKLSEAVFSPRAVLMKAGVSVRISCKVLIYQTNTAFLTLHVYLIPCDPGLQQAMDKRESSYGYKIIRKPHPEKSLKMKDRFVLAADLDAAEIYPEKLKLRYESKNPNFFEVFIENPATNFKLKLTKEKEDQPVWTCAVRTDEYQRGDHIEGQHFVDKHQVDLIQRVHNMGSILDRLLREGVVQQEGYDKIAAIPTTRDQMRNLYSGPLNAAGQAGKDIFYKILQKEEPHLVMDLKKKES